jgi:hypothetical protein
MPSKKISLHPDYLNIAGRCNSAKVWIPTINIKL